MLTKSDIAQVEQIIGHHLGDTDLLRQVFIHRSYLNENPGCRLPNNERLEFLGDAVLELVATEYLYGHYPNPEGELTNWRSALVRGQHLAVICDRLGLGQWLQLSRGEAKAGGKGRQILLANMFEALLGAVYLDLGYEPVRDFIHRTVIGDLNDILEQELHIDPKSRLQELTQAKEGITPHYLVLSEEGPDHAKQFTVGVYLGSQKLAEATGPSKQASEQVAATEAIRQRTERN